LEIEKNPDSAESTAILFADDNVPAARMFYVSFRHISERSTSPSTNFFIEHPTGFAQSAISRFLASRPQKVWSGAAPQLHDFSYLLISSTQPWFRNLLPLEFTCHGVS
jgi:hypothetical protein